MAPAFTDVCDRLSVHRLTGSRQAVSNAYTSSMQDAEETTTNPRMRGKVGLRSRLAAADSNFSSL